MIDLVMEDGHTVAQSWMGDLTELDGATVAVSGASGLIGRHIISLLLGLSEVYGLKLTVIALGRSRARLDSVLSGWRDDSRLSLIEADISNKNAWPSVASHLIHAASPATPSAFAQDPVGVIKANVLGTLNAIDCVADSGAYLSLVSTMEIYGSVPIVDELTDISIDEHTLGLIDPLDIRSAYPESKRVAENLIMDAGSQYGLKGDIVRISHTYGPGTSIADNRAQVEFVKQAVLGEAIILKSDGKLRRHYTYAADSASAIVRILTTRNQRVFPEAFNVADNASRVSIRQLAELALLAAGRNPDELVIDIQQPAGLLWSTMRGATFLNTRKVESLGWKPIFTMETGMPRMAEYIKQQCAKEPVNTKEMSV